MSGAPVGSFDTALTSAVHVRGMMVSRNEATVITAEKALWIADSIYSDSWYHLFVHDGRKMNL